MTIETDLERILKGAARVVVVGIGDELQPDDRDGLDAARSLAASPPPRTSVLLGGALPENQTGAIRRAAPTHVVLLDAAELGAPPGSVEVIDPARVRGQRFSTHAMPLSTLAQYLRDELGARVMLLGIQPGADGAQRAARVVRDAIVGVA